MLRKSTDKAELTRRLKSDSCITFTQAGREKSAPPME